MLKKLARRNRHVVERNGSGKRLTTRFAVKNGKKVCSLPSSSLQPRVADRTASYISGENKAYAKLLREHKERAGEL